MTNDTTEPVANLPWGTEWRNVPLGPVSATDGPREDWDIAGVELLKQLLRLPSSPHRLLPLAHHSFWPIFDQVLQIPLALRSSRISQSAVGNAFRLERIFNPSLTRRLVNKARMIGCTMSHLFEASHCMVMLARNHLQLTTRDAYHFSANSSA
jgi:hypothetical protein